MRCRKLAWALVAVLFLAGCGSSAGGENGSVTPGVADTTSLQELRASLDHMVFPSPHALAEERSLAVVGTLEEISEGQAVIANYPEEKVRVRDNTAVLRIKVVREFQRGSGDVSPDGEVFVSLRRGVTEIDEEGNVIGIDAAPSIDQLRKELPVGVRVAVIASAEPRELEGFEEFGRDPSPGPEGTNLLFGGHPQAVTFDQGKAELDEWPGLTFEELLAGLDAR